MDISTIEYLHIFNPFYYCSNPKNPNNPNTHYYDRVYLCIEKEKEKEKDKVNFNMIAPIKGFNCLKFNNFEEADAEYYNNFSQFDRRSTMIPICKYVPFYFDPFIVDYKLKNKFWLGKHNFLQQSKKNKE